MDSAIKLSVAWAAVRDDQSEDLLDEIGVTWWRVHRLAQDLDVTWAHDLDASLLETKALARQAVSRGNRNLSDAWSL